MILYLMGGYVHLDIDPNLGLDHCVGPVSSSNTER